MTLDDLRELVRLGGPETGNEARRMALRATKDVADDDVAETLREALAEHLCAMVFDYDLGEAVGENLVAVSVSDVRALALIDQIEAVLLARS